MLDVIIFGATGVTGSYCIPHLHKLSKDKGRNLTWGVAGRSEEKLKSILDKMSRKIGVDLSATPIFLADINDYQSLLAMTRQTRLLLNCCGPFRHTGKYAVNACLESGTHHVDVSAELDFSEYLETDIHEKAKEKGLYFLTTCGFDSAIFDMGLIYLQKNFQGILNSVDIYFSVFDGENTTGPSAHYTTWASVIDILSDNDSYKATCRRAQPKNMPKLLPAIKENKFPHKPRNVKGWAGPLISNDKYVLNKTQAHLYKMKNKRPVQSRLYHLQDTLFEIIMFKVVYFLLLVMSKFRFTRWLLLNYAAIFTLGTVGKTLNEECVEKSENILNFYGEGWKAESLENIENEVELCKPVDSSITMTISIKKNAHYGTTALLLVLSGILILTKKEILGGSGKGGVYTPGVAFEKTSFMEELMENGIEINIKSSRDINIS